MMNHPNKTIYLTIDLSKIESQYLNCTGLFEMSIAIVQKLKYMYEAFVSKLYLKTLLDAK